MLLESALFLHPSMAAYLVGEMATATKYELLKLSPKKVVKKSDNDLINEGTDEEVSMPEIDGAINADGDLFDPFTCDDDNPCPTTPFEYECKNGSCVPILPKRSVSNPSIKEAMLADWNCYITPVFRGVTLYCKGDWPKSRYPLNSFGGRGVEQNRVEIGKAQSVIPYSMLSENVGPLSEGGLLSLDWFAQPVKSVIPMDIDFEGFTEGWSIGWEYQYAKSRDNAPSVAVQPHDLQRILPSDLSRCADTSDARCIPDNAIGVKPMKEDYEWGSWLSHEWRNECKVSWSREVNLCNGIDSRCHFRCKYRAYFVPDPTDPRFVSKDKGQRKGALYGANSQANGVQPQTLLIEIEGQDTTDCWSYTSNWGCSTDSSFSPAAGDEYSIKIYRYTSSSDSSNLVVTTRVTADGYGKAIFSYPLPKEGLYQVVIDHEVSGNGCITKGPNVNDYLKNASPYHVNFGFFVSPPPSKRGCTDSESTNYDNAAVVDDGSCYGGGDGGLFDWFGGLFGGSNDNTGSLVNRQNVDSEGSNFSMGLVVASAATLGVIALLAGGNGGEE